MDDIGPNHRSEVDIQSLDLYRDGYRNEVIFDI